MSNHELGCPLRARKSRRRRVKLIEQQQVKAPLALRPRLRLRSRRNGKIDGVEIFDRLLPPVHAQLEILLC